ncbi:MAG: hypothetical protein M9907_08640 [Burkholderiaceae bacterium]|nr:hypothetical protein [Burkholderiaceae bacterium]
MKREPCTVAFEGAALPPALLELFEHCVRHGLYDGDADRASLLAMHRLDPGATCDLVGEMAARVLRCRRCAHFRRPGLADQGYCGERADLPIVYGLLHALPPDGGAWCPLFASTEVRP